MRALLRLKPYLRPYLWLIVASGLLAIPLAALRVSPAPLVQHYVDRILVSKDSQQILLFPILILGLYLANFFVRFGHYYLLRIVVARVNQRLKNKLYEHLLGLSADYYTAQSTGTLISRVGSDTQYVDGGISSINTAIREPITFLFYMSYALYVNWKLTLVTLGIVPPLAYVFSRTGRNLKRYIGKMTEENARLFSVLQETFTGIRMIKMFKLEKYVRKRFRERSENFTRLLLKTAVLEEASHPSVELITAFAIAAVMFFGGRLVLMDQLTPGEFSGFVLAFGMMMHPLRLMNDLTIKLSQAAAACDRIFAVFDWKPNLVEAPDPKPLPEFSREVRFRDVSFAYPDSPARGVLKGVSFSLARGKTIAIVGASGSGKSSLVSLLPRLFDVNGGSIEIDGVDIREYALDDLRSRIAVVSQDVFLFNDTIEENIRCGRLSATREEIREAARKAHAHSFIEMIPDGYAAVIGDRGQKLSGGERQRLSIARAFLREAPILILDEATSSLDTASERAVQEALDDLMVNRTTIVIAHRLSTVRGADTILVLKDGEIVESGRHEDLMKKGGEYSRFHELQQA
ncbi:MAG TPA: ABC transporter ATP-binding protein [Bdellovibrionota bacterium]|nr:ABC transporter ATP-binding protein [Bdellovibrionota bacterium]